MFAHPTDPRVKPAQVGASTASKVSQSQFWTPIDNFSHIAGTKGSPRCWSRNAFALERGSSDGHSCQRSNSYNGKGEASQLLFPLSHDWLAILGSLSGAVIRMAGKNGHRPVNLLDDQHSNQLMRQGHCAERKDGRRTVPHQRIEALRASD